MRKYLFLLCICALFAQGCAFAMKRSSYVVDKDNLNSEVISTCKVPGKNGESAKVIFPGGKDIEISVQYGDGPVWGGPPLVPFIPLHLSENNEVVRISIKAAKGISYNRENSSITLNDSSEKIAPSKKDNANYKTDDQILFNITKKTKIELITLNLSEISIDKNPAVSRKIKFHRQRAWIYYPLILMADQLGVGPTHYYCDQ